ncbi:uncharacterized protein LOC110238733 [Exaiptasia diaphana]|uniref:Uncharacterized protein n=1 Tax=Exaiptasia diaphana TaxID=2652724 RepID=A0A913X7A3_EXADI|nr:uncharacterized protein LOC110238733 [Exaiptasia diaphana]
MATRMIFVLAAFLNLFTCQVQAQNNTASSASPTATLTMTVATTSAGLTATTTQQAMATTSQQIKPTPTTTSAPSASVSLDFETILNATAKYTGTCQNEKDENIKNETKDLFKDKAYDLRNVQITTEQSGEDCKVKITLTFGKGLTKNDILVKFENASNGEIGGVTLKDFLAGVFVVGVNLGDYKATEEECKAKCCGTGGPITVRRSCTDENGNKSPKCLNYRIKKEVKDCNSVCNVKDLCGAGMSIHVSLLMLTFGGLLSWVLKE